MLIFAGFIEARRNPAIYRETPKMRKTSWAIILAAVFLVGCGHSKPSIAGNWRDVSVFPQGYQVPTTGRFDADGTVQWDLTTTLGKVHVAGTYLRQGSTLTEKAANLAGTPGVSKAASGPFTEVYQYHQIGDSLSLSLFNSRAYSPLRRIDINLRRVN